MSQSFNYAVVGGGTHGLSVAYQLSKTGNKIALFQQFTIGHNQGSSHGKTRIIRCAYQRELFRDMAKLAKQSVWPTVQKQLDCAFIYQNPFLYFDQTESAINLKRTAQTDKSHSLKQTSYKQMKQKYQNLFDLQECYGVVDTTAGIVNAELYIKKLAQYLRKQPNVTIFENTEVSQVTSNPSGAKIVLKNGQIYQSQKVALSAGKFITKLAKELANLFSPILQIVCYLQLQNPQMYKVGKFPSFVYNCKEGNYFGLPQTCDQGVKIGQQILRMSSYANDKEKRIENIKKMVSRLFGKRVIKIKKWQQCWYTMTKTEDFILDWCDESQKILIVSACSGHGFKFSPLIGKIGSDLICKDKSIEVFEENRQVFRIQYHLGINLM